MRHKVAAKVRQVYHDVAMLSIIMKIVRIIGGKREVRSQEWRRAW
jgi:hypothetical protein